MNQQDFLSEIDRHRVHNYHPLPIVLPATAAPLRDRSRYQLSRD